MADTSDATEPSRLLVFVQASLSVEGETLYTEGPILIADGAAAAELQESGLTDILDLCIAPPPAPGLMIWEGWHELTAGPEPDMELNGWWRRPTHWELCRLHAGLSPFDDSSPLEWMGGRRG